MVGCVGVCWVVAWLWFVGLGVPVRLCWLWGVVVLFFERCVWLYCCGGVCLVLFRVGCVWWCWFCCGFWLCVFFVFGLRCSVFCMCCSVFCVCCLGVFLLVWCVVVFGFIVVVCIFCRFGLGLFFVVLIDVDNCVFFCGLVDLMVGWVFHFLFWFYFVWACWVWRCILML